MIRIAESLFRASVAVVRIPVSVVADAVTMGGALTDREEPYTATAARDAMKNLEDAARPRDEECER